MASKLDNTKQTIYDFKGVVLDENEDSEITLTHDDFGEPVKLLDILKEYFGKEIDFKIGGAIKVSSDLFIGEDE